LASLGPVVLLLGLLTTPVGRRGLFDAAFVLGLGAVFLILPRPPALERAVRTLSVPVWALAVAGGLLAMLGSGASAAELASPVLFAPLGWLAR
jgi:hypothetical protein